MFEMAQIGERLRTQDNRITEQPIFLVQNRRHKRARWEYVQPFFTEAAADLYIKQNGHNHRGELRTYADGSFRNHEWRAVRDMLLCTVESSR